MLHPSEYHPSVSRFVNMQLKRGTVFVPDPERELSRKPIWDSSCIADDAAEARKFKAAGRKVKNAAQRARKGIPEEMHPTLVAGILQEVADEAGISVADLKASGHDGPTVSRVSMARDKAVWRCRTEVGARSTLIAEILCRCNHSFVSPAVQRHQVRVDGDPANISEARKLKTAVEQIKSEVSLKHGVTVEDIDSPKRALHMVAARHECMWRLRNETGASYHQIARQLGGKDHTSVISGIRRHQARIDAGEA